MQISDYQTHSCRSSRSADEWTSVYWALGVFDQCAAEQPAVTAEQPQSVAALPQACPISGKLVVEPFQTVS